jgi:antitoxin HigA-1
MIMPHDYPIPHPGELLREEFLIPMGITVYALAKAIHVPRSRINEICRGNQGITASIAVRLGKFFGTDPQWFLNMQSQYDLENACLDLADKLDAIEPYQTAA